MFDDIISNTKKRKKKIKYDLDVCPFCGSLDIEDTGGVIASKTLYVQSMVCNTCFEEWNIHYDQDLNFISIDY